MKVIKEGGHRLFEEDQETTQYVREMLDDLRKSGMDAVRKYSQKFDDWNPGSFELSQQQIGDAIAKCDQQLVQDTEFCQRNVRAFAEAQLASLHPLEVEISPGIFLGHKHIPITTLIGSKITDPCLSGKRQRLPMETSPSAPITSCRPAARHGTPAVFG